MAEKQILTIGYTIPGFDDNRIDFYNGKSLMDGDILLISPGTLEPRGHWVSFTVRDGGCYDVDASKTYKQKIFSLKKEVEDHLNTGKNVFVFLTKKEDYSLSSDVSTEKKGMTTYISDTASNYDFLPINLGKLTSAEGTHVEFNGNPLFKDFYEKFHANLEYKLYIENFSGNQVIFTGKDKSKILGAIYKVKKGHIIVLPFLNYSEKKFTERKESKSYWTADAVKFGKILVKAIKDIDQNLRSSGEKPPLLTG